MLEDFFEFGLDGGGDLCVDGLLQAFLEIGVVGKFRRDGRGGVLDELVWLIVNAEQCFDCSAFFQQTDDGVIIRTTTVFMSYSLVMSLVWIVLESPDLAITEAAVGAGVTSLLFFVALKKIHALHPDDEKSQLKNGMTEEKNHVSDH